MAGRLQITGSAFLRLLDEATPGVVIEESIVGVIGYPLSRVGILVATGNRRSRAIPERLGFREEGMLRQFQLVGDRYLDCVSYSMLASDGCAADDVVPVTRVRPLD